MICLALHSRGGLSATPAGVGIVSPRRRLPAACPRRRPARPQPSRASLGPFDSGSLSSGDSEDPISSSALNRELERRTGKFNKLAEHLDLLLSASETVRGSLSRR